MAAARWEQGQRQGSRIFLMYLSVEVGGALTDLVYMAEDGTITTTESANTFVPDVGVLREFEVCRKDEESLILVQAC